MEVYILSIEIFNLSGLVAFLLGIVAGIVIFGAIFALVATRNLKEVKKSYGPTVEDFKEEKIMEMVKAKQDALINEVEENDADCLKTTLSLSLELIRL